MCGIAGVIERQQGAFDVEAMIASMQRAIHHRGPDDTGNHCEPERGFLNVRLAIVDIAGGSQPIYSDDRDIGIVYNGEVYNFPELREDLERRGHSFHTNCDTEVVLRLYQEFGTESFAMLNGMFALCIWDNKNDVTYIARDSFGTKPLYYYQDDKGVVFASEQKALLQLPGLDLELDPAGFQDYLTFRYIHAPFTIFKRIRRLEAGMFLRYKDGCLAQFRYDETSYSDPYPTPDEAECREELERLLLASVKSQLMGEVPIGVLLSGGIDSSAIAYFVHQLGADLTTYNIGFPEVNEFEFSREVAKAYDLKHVEVLMTREELLADFDATVLALDEPIADPACFPLYQLCKELKKSVTVVLSGEGGDELFAGYPQYYHTSQIPKERAVTFEDFLQQSFYFVDGYQFLRDQTLPPHILRHRKYFQEQPLLNGMLAYDMKTWMPDDLMMKADKILMSHSLEGRFPFLDRNLYRFACNLPQHYKLGPDGTTKKILKDVMRPKLPESIIDRPKMGFSVPITEFLDTTLKDRVHEAVQSLHGTDAGEILDIDAIKHLVKTYYTGAREHALQVWTIFILCYWLQVRK